MTRAAWSVVESYLTDVALFTYQTHISAHFIKVSISAQLCCPSSQEDGKLGSDNKIQTKIGSAANKHLRNGWTCLSGSNYFCWARVLSKSARVVV